jgi:hypothetical protein
MQKRKKRSRNYFTGRYIQKSHVQRYLVFLIDNKLSLEDNYFEYFIKGFEVKIAVSDLKTWWSSDQGKCNA